MRPYAGKVGRVAPSSTYMLQLTGCVMVVQVFGVVSVIPPARYTARIRLFPLLHNAPINQFGGASIQHYLCLILEML